MQQTRKSDTIDYLKAFAAIFVVLHHAIIYIDADRQALVWEILRNLVMSTHVPLFFTVAGFLCYRQDFKTYIRKKLSRLLVPFFLFSGLKLVYSIFVSNDFAHGGSIGSQLFDAFIIGRLYWFPYAILISYCLAPLFWTPKNETPTNFRRIAVALAIVGLVLVNRRYYLPDIQLLSYFQVGSALRFFVYFLVGIYVRQNQELLRTHFRKRKWILIPLCLGLMAFASFLLVWKRNQYQYSTDVVLAFSFMTVLFAICRKLPANIRPLKLLGKYSLQVMFFDSFNKVVLFAVLQHFTGSTPLLILAAVVCNLLATCLCCLVIERIPRVRTLFGL